MRTSRDTKKIVELTLLWEIAKALNGNLSPQELLGSLNQIFQIFLNVDSLKIWLYDENTEILSAFSKDWYIDNKLIGPNGLLNIKLELKKLLYGEEEISIKFDEFRKNSQRYCEESKNSLD